MAAAAGLACTVIVLLECAALACMGTVSCAKLLRRRYRGSARTVELPTARDSWTPYVDHSFLTRQMQSEEEGRTSRPDSEATAADATAAQPPSNDDDYIECERCERGDNFPQEDELGNLLQIIEQRGTALQAELMRKLAGAVAVRRAGRSLEMLPTLSYQLETSAVRLHPLPKNNIEETSM